MTVLIAAVVLPGAAALLQNKNRSQEHAFAKKMATQGAAASVQGVLIQPHEGGTEIRDHQEHLELSQHKILISKLYFQHNISTGNTF